MLDQGVVGLEPLGAVSAGEGQLVVSLLAVTHDVFSANFSNSTVGTEVDPVLEKIFRRDGVSAVTSAWRLRLRKLSKCGGGWLLELEGKLRYSSCFQLETEIARTKELVNSPGDFH